MSGANTEPQLTLYAAATSELQEPKLAMLRHLLDTAFDGDFSEDDWQHTLGGTHVWVGDDTRIISHGALVARAFICGAQVMRVGYVEAVATHPDHRRLGYAAAVLRLINQLIFRRYDIGALSTGEHRVYESAGWERWRGQTSVKSPNGIVRTPDDDDSVMILRAPNSMNVDVSVDLICDYRSGDVW